MPSSSLSSKPSRGRPKGSTSTSSICKVTGHTNITRPQRKATLIDPTVKAAVAEISNVQQNLPDETSITCEHNSRPLPPDISPNAIQKICKLCNKTCVSCLSEKHCSLLPKNVHRLMLFSPSFSSCAPNNQRTQ
ncbi:hypothetical protein GEMRC1_004781 [Eukaryota sp. GEM-RC1]